MRSGGGGLPDKLRWCDSTAARSIVEAGPVVNLPAECQGPSGLVAVFTQHIERMMLLEEYVYLLVGPGGLGSGELRSVEKRSGAVEPLYAGALPTFFQAPFPELASRLLGTKGMHGLRIVPAALPETGPA